VTEVEEIRGKVTLEERGLVDAHWTEKRHF